MRLTEILLIEHELNGVSHRGFIRAVIADLIRQGVTCSTMFPKELFNVINDCHSDFRSVKNYPLELKIIPKFKRTSRFLNVLNVLIKIKSSDFTRVFFLNGDLLLLPLCILLVFGFGRKAEIYLTVHRIEPLENRVSGRVRSLLLKWLGKRKCIKLVALAQSVYFELSNRDLPAVLYQHPCRRLRVNKSKGILIYKRPQFVLELKLLTVITNFANKLSLPLAANVSAIKGVEVDVEYLGVYPDNECYDRFVCESKIVLLLDDSGGRYASGVAMEVISSGAVLIAPRSSFFVEISGLFDSVFLYDASANCMGLNKCFSENLGKIMELLGDDSGTLYDRLDSLNSKFFACLLEC